MATKFLGMKTDRKLYIIIVKYMIFFFSSPTSKCDESWKVYDESQLAVINIIVDEEDLEWMYQNVDSDSIHMASIHFQNAYINDQIDSVGFRLRGNTSRNAEKKSFKVDFDHYISGREFYDVEKLNLNGEHNDPSIIRSKLSWDFYQQIGMQSSRASHVKVYINNIYYGLYISVEHIDNTFLAKNFKNDNGNLWKCIWPADLTYRGSQPENYFPYYGEDRPYELKTNRDQYDYSKLARLIRIIHLTPDSLDMVLNIKTTLQYFAMNILMGSWDDYRFLRNNFYLYHNPDNDLIHWVPFDYDNSFGIDWFNIDWSTINPYQYPVIDNDGRPLTEYLFSHSRYRNLFSHFLQFYNNQLFNQNIIQQKLDHHLEFLLSAALEDTFRTLDYNFSSDDFEASYGDNYQNQHVKQGILEFIIDRKESINSQIIFDDNLPMVYDFTANNKTIILGDSITMKFSIYGSPSNVHLYYSKVGEDEWDSIDVSFEPDYSSDLIELHDQWLTNIHLQNEGNYKWYLKAFNNEGSDRYPIFGFKNFNIVNQFDSNNLVINEILAINNSINFDGYGEYDDWIEIWNNSSAIIDLSGFYLTDKVNNLTKWQFPESSAILNPNDYILVWCDEDQDQGNLHTNFKLSSNGEFLGFLYPDGVTFVDSISFPAQTQNISFGRLSNDAQDWVYLNPTPLSPNLELVSIEKPIYIESFKLRNIYPNPFNKNLNIEISSSYSNDNLEIYIYSLKGSLVYAKSLSPFISGDKKVNIEMDNTVASGIYFLKLITNNNIITRKISFIK